MLWYLERDQAVICRKQHTETTSVSLGTIRELGREKNFRICLRFIRCSKRLALTCADLFAFLNLR